MFSWPWTKAGAKISGQSPLSRNVLGQKSVTHWQKNVKKLYFFFLKMDFFLFVPSVLCLIPTQDIADCQNPILVCPVAKFQNLSCPVLSCPGPSGDEMSKSCPVPYHCKIFRLFHSPFLPLCCIGNCKFWLTINLYFKLETLAFTLLLSPSSFQNAQIFLDGASVTNPLPIYLLLLPILN